MRRRRLRTSGPWTSPVHGAPTYRALSDRGTQPTDAPSQHEHTCEGALRAAHLHDALVAQGIELLTISHSCVQPNLLLVFLHGNAGQWVEGGALRKIKRIPGVVTAANSRDTQTIVLVDYNAPGKREPPS